MLQRDHRGQARALPVRHHAGDDRSRGDGGELFPEHEPACERSIRLRQQGIRRPAGEGGARHRPGRAHARDRRAAEEAARRHADGQSLLRPFRRRVQHARRGLSPDANPGRLLPGRRETGLSSRRLHRLVGAARADPVGALSAALLILVALTAIGAPWLAPYDPVKQRVAERLARPSVGHPFGTDDFGRDVLSRLIVGARPTLLTAALSVLIACLIGSSVGTIAGYFGGRIESVSMMFIDIMLSFPLVLLALLIVAVLGAGLVNLILAVGISQIPLFARLARSLALTLRSREYVVAGLSLGAGQLRVLRRHVVPNMLGPIGVQATTTMALAIVTTSSLSFLGFGIQPPAPDWGVMVFEARRFLFDRPDILLYPAIAIVVTVISLNVLTDSLLRLLDPTARGMLA
ncbi:MAG: hypothetical protein DMD81_07040 [Candidatus Rokuibacteriota bacterium]|nr:MAG: hypothetical protein DMD81_07040 [Candidatus Rokubacteria bacterium]